MNSILIIVLDNLGDAVMATALCPAINSLFPRAKIGFWTKEYTAGAFENQPHIAYLHKSDPFWDRSPGHGKGRFTRFAKTLREIRRVSYDAALILNTEWRRSLAALVAGIPIRVGYDRRSSKPFLTHAYPYRKNQHIVNDHLILLSDWAGKALNDLQYFPHLSGSMNGRKKIIALHPFSGDPERKNWPLPLWGELIRNVSRSRPDHSFVVVGAYQDAPEVEKLAGGLHGQKLMPFINRPLRELIELLGSAQLFVGGDSGPGHIAAAVGTPVISLFGSFNPERCRPIGASVTVIKRDPLKDLSPQEVEAKIVEMLK